VGIAPTGNRAAVGGHVEPLDVRMLDSYLTLQVSDEVFGVTALVGRHSEEVGGVPAGNHDEVTVGQRLKVQVGRERVGEVVFSYSPRTSLVRAKGAIGVEVRFGDPEGGSRWRAGVLCRAAPCPPHR